MEGYLFVNNGDGEIYVNSVSYYDEATKRIKVDFINKAVKPGEFLDHRPKRSELGGFTPLMTDPENRDQVFYAINKSFPGLSVEYGLPGSDFLGVIEQSAHANPENLIRTQGTATVRYFGSKNATLQTEAVSVIGIVWRSKDLTTLPDKQGIDQRTSR